MLLKLTALRLWLTMLLFVFSAVAFAQKRVTGTVTDANGKPVSGASVVVRGTSNGTTTDEQGRFTITVPNDQARLSVSYVGLDAKEVAVGTSGTVAVSLTSTGSTLNEVVVTGYSTQARKDITGSVTVVRAEDLKSVPAANAEQQLQGRAAGVTVTTSGVPGQAATVRIRGFGSFSNNEPLFIVDGIPTNSIQNLNPNDIESMQVLKDAAAASIYGSRASNGVIVVTTRQGRQGTAKVSYNTYYGLQHPGKGFKNLLNPQEMADLTFLAYRNSGQTPPNNQYGSGATPVLPDYLLVGGTGGAGIAANDPRANISNYRLDRNDPGNAYLIVPANKAGTNWFDEITRVAPMMNHNISVSGGANRSKYLFSLDYFDQKAITVFNFYKRYTGRINTEFTVRDNIRIGENLQISYDENNGTGGTTSNGNFNNEGTPIAFSYRLQPIVPVRDIAGNYAGSRGPGPG
jgi:TonB-linked SusC/RagA family outer membrane protein